MPDPRRILLAPDAFKGTLGAPEFCRVVADTLAEVRPGAEVVACPLADGGEGTLSVWSDATGARRQELETLDALGRPIRAHWGRSADGRQGLVELAAASGLAGLEGALDPLAASTRGTGELMRAAARAGCETVIVALGGSATVDGGAGALSALGIRFLDGRGHGIAAGGGGLGDLARVEATGVDGVVAPVRWIAAADVDNPLLGPHGAVAVYGPQKGAGPREREILEAGLARLAEVSGRAALAERPGAGAAGGCGFGLAAWLDADLVSGFDWLAAVVGFDDQLARCDLVITGEGRFDRQSRSGKVVGKVLARARSVGVPVLVVAGEAESSADPGPGGRLITLVGDGVDRERARGEAAAVLARRIREWAESDRPDGDRA